MTTQEVNQAAIDAIALIEKTRDEAISRIAPKRPDLNETVVVAGITWGAHLTPSEHCEAPSEFNEETGVWYFDQKTSAPLHAFEQNLRIATDAQFQQLYDRTTQRVEKIGELKYMVFTDKETDEELWVVFGGLYDFDDKKFRSVGIEGLLWSSSVYDYCYGFYLRINESNGVFPRNASYRAYGFPVRCVAE